jgi:hypothetical protein
MPMCRVLRSPISSSCFVLGATLLVISQLTMLTITHRLGVTPISTLSEWTNVLHLSAKWGFEHLRSAAITAILPLASAVDKLVLGRTYGFVNWVPGAYTDLLKREDDLTLDEAKKMALEDVVAIAKGRREARTERIKPDVDIEEIVKSLLPVAAPEMPESDIASKDATPAVSTSAVDDIPSDQSQAHPTSADDKAKISRWVDQMTTASVRAVPQECFVKFMQEDRSRVPLVLDAILGRGLKEVSQTMETRGTLLYRSTIYGDAMADGSRHVDLRKMHNRDPPLGLINSKQTEDACLRVIVEHWHPLIDLDLAICTDSLTATPAWKSLNRAMRYLVYLNGETYLPGEGYMDPVLNSSVYAAFWIALETLYRSTHLSNQLALARWTYVLLTQFSHDASKLAVCNEMDGFYETIEETRSAAPSEHQELISVLNVSITPPVFLFSGTEPTLSRTSSGAGSGPRRDQNKHSICYGYFI